MTTGRETERRRQPRWPAGDDLECRVEVHRRVRLLDISGTGALLEAAARLPVGTHGHLRIGIGPTFTPDIEIRRVAGGEPPTVAMGAIFTAMDDRSRRSLEAFLSKANV
jgi:hypothetical protein